MAVRIVACTGVLAAAQDRPVRRDPQKSTQDALGEGRLEGRVLSDSDLPLRRARVILRPAEAGLSTLGVEADDHGEFSLQKIPPGRYTLLAEREGYLSSATCLKGALRMPPMISIGATQSITNLTFRLRPWAVLSGRIKFDDGEPGIGIRVDVFREYRNKGRQGYRIAASSRTNDRGEYRVFGLQPGEYLVSAAFDRPPPSANYIQQPRRDAEGRELPVFGYATTFYPATTRLSEAVPVRLEYASEVGGIDLFLKPVVKVRVRGRVVSGISGVTVTSPVIALEQLDAEKRGTVVSMANARNSAVGFELRDIAPGQYLLEASGSDAGKTLTGRALVTVTDQDVDNLNVMINAERAGLAQFRIEGGGRLASRTLRVTLEPRSETGPMVNGNTESSGFRYQVHPDETYDVFIQNLPDDFYVASVRVNGGDVMAAGFEGWNSSLDKPFEVVLDSRGGRVGGRVIGPDGTVWSGANLMLIPDPAEGRLQAYRDGVADEYGIFQLRGVPPGKYVLVAWLDDPPCDFYDPSGLEACRAAGQAVAVDVASQQAFEFKVRLPSRR